MELSHKNTSTEDMQAFLDDLHRNGMSAYWETRGEAGIDGFSTVRYI